MGTSARWRLRGSATHFAGGCGLLGKAALGSAGRGCPDSPSRHIGHRMPITGLSGRLGPQSLGTKTARSQGAGAEEPEVPSVLAIRRSPGRAQAPRRGPAPSGRNAVPVLGSVRELQASAGDGGGWSPIGRLRTRHTERGGLGPGRGAAGRARGPPQTSATTIPRASAEGGCAHLVTRKCHRTPPPCSP